MGFEFIKKLPTPDEIRNQYPIDAKIKALKEQMEATLRSSEDVVNRTNALNDNLRSQSQAFENSTSNTLNKAIEFEDILNNLGIAIFVIIFFIFCITAALLDEKFGIFRKLKKR